MRRRHRIVAGASSCKSHSVQGARRHLVVRSSTRSESRAWWLVRLSRRRRTTFRVKVFKKTHSQDRDRCGTMGTDRAIESQRWDTVGGLRYRRYPPIWHPFPNGPPRRAGGVVADQGTPRDSDTVEGRCYVCVRSWSACPKTEVPCRQREHPTIEWGTRTVGPTRA